MIDRSPFHFIGGRKLNREEVKILYGDRSTLYANMINNDCQAVVLSNNGPSWCQPLRPDDIIVNPPESPRR